MQILTGFLFILNFAAWLTFTIACWWFTGTSMGVIAILGLITFIIAWGISGEASLSISDYITQDEFEIFVSKLKWSNTTTLIVMFIFLVIFLALDWFELRDFWASIQNK